MSDLDRLLGWSVSAALVGDSLWPRVVEGRRWWDRRSVTGTKGLAVVGGMRVTVDLTGLLGVGASLGANSLGMVVVETATAPDLGVVVVDVGSLIGAREETGKAGGALRPVAGGSGPEGSTRVAMGTAARERGRRQERAELAMLKATGAGGEGIELATGGAAAAAVEAHVVEDVADGREGGGGKNKMAAATPRPRTSVGNV